MIGFFELHWFPLLISFIAALVATTVAAAAENKYNRHNVLDSAKGGFVQGLVFGFFACGAYVVFEMLKESA